MLETHLTPGCTPMAHPKWMANLDLAILIPCLNEAATITKVIEDLRRTLPTARIFVADNGSTDDTATRAHTAGARVLTEPLRGKGNALRRLLRDVDAEAYLMIDGDATYDPRSAGLLVRCLIESTADVVLGSRSQNEEHAYRPGHRLYNRGLSFALRTIFRRNIVDPLTGYRCLSRRFAKAFPATADGFEVEVEMDLFLLQSRLAFAQVDTPYAARPDGSLSKLSSYRDGARIALFLARSVVQRRAWILFSPLAAGLTGWIGLSSQLDITSAPGLSLVAVLSALIAGFSWNHAQQTGAAALAGIQSQPQPPSQGELEARETPGKTTASAQNRER